RPRSRLHEYSDEPSNHFRQIRSRQLLAGRLLLRELRRHAFVQGGLAGSESDQRRALWKSGAGVSLPVGPQRSLLEEARQVWRGGSVALPDHLKREERQPLIFRPGQSVDD